MFRVLLLCANDIAHIIIARSFSFQEFCRLNGALPEHCLRICSMLKLDDLIGSRKDHLVFSHNASAAAHKTEFDKKADVTDLNSHVNNSDIHVNPTTMGNYDTAISGLIDHTEDTDIHTTAEEKAGMVENIYLGRLGAPEDIARAVCFLAGEDGGYVTGQILGVDGAMVI